MALVFAFQSCSAQFVAMSGRTLQFLRYIEKKKSTYVRYLSQCHFDQSLTVTWPGNQKAWPLVSWLVNSGIWQRRNSEMSWLFLQCSGSECFFGPFADQKKHLAYCWRVLGPIEERGLILWLKMCGVFSREPRWLPTFYLFSFPHLPFLITRSITLKTTQECTWSNRKRHCTSKCNNIVLQVLFLKNIHG